LFPRNPVAKDKCHSSRKEISSPELLKTTRLQFWSFTTLSIFREVPNKKEEQPPKKLVMSFQSYSLESFAARFRRNPSRTLKKAEAGFSFLRETSNGRTLSSFSKTPPRSVNAMQSNRKGLPHSSPKRKANPLRLLIGIQKSSHGQCEFLVLLLGGKPLQNNDPRGNHRDTP